MIVGIFLHAPVNSTVLRLPFSIVVFAESPAVPQLPPVMFIFGGKA